MALHLDALVVDAADPPRLAAFWAGLLRWDLVDDPAEGPRLVPTDGTRFSILFEPNDEPKRGPNQLHLDLTSTSLDDQAATVARALRLGARHLDIGQRPEEGHVVLADPEGNELCVVGPGNRFLEGCGFVGAMACDGSRATGRFWSEALGWPLVWDEGEETAIQSPAGGTKISWGGPPLAPKLAKVRWHLDVAPPAGGDQQAEVDRLLALGAAPVDIGQGDVPWIVLADPDGHEFCVLTPR